MAVETAVQDALKQVDETRRVVIGPGTVARTGEVFRESFGNVPALVVADTRTQAVAGEAAARSLVGAGVDLRPARIFSGQRLSAEYGRVMELAALFEHTGAVPVAVGSGTINDLVKLAANLAGRSYLCVATAASMDGYTSYGASITRDGIKQTIHCPAPRALVCDIDIVREAPASMSAAGYADLLAKVTAGADWLLADHLDIEPVHRGAWDMMQPQLVQWLSDPAGVRAGEARAIGRLLTGLILAGLGMQLAKSSRPASGAEHQFSHLWEMEGLRHGPDGPSHGFKVAIGTLAAATLYQRVLACDMSRLETGPLVAGWPGLEDRIRRLQGLHPEAPIRAAVAQALPVKHIGKAQLRERLERIKRDWPGLAGKLRRQLLPADTLREQLEAAGAPTRPGQIGLARQRLEASHALAMGIRSRYTILDFACETGLLRVPVSPSP